MIKDWLHSCSIKSRIALLLAGVVLTGGGCGSRHRLPQRGSAEYSEAVSDFYVGLAALQVGQDIVADQKLSDLTRVVPDEPAGWANWGILALRQQNFDLASQRLTRARELAPKNDRIYMLQGVLESQRGNSGAAIAAFRKAEELNPSNVRTIYLLAQEIERQNDADSANQFQQRIQKILEAQPQNLAALLDLARAAAKRNDGATLQSAIARIRAQSAPWPPEVQDQLNQLETAASSSDFRGAATQATFLRNVLMRVPEFRSSLDAIKAPVGEEAQPFDRFVRLEPPTFEPAPADLAMRFDSIPLPSLDGEWNWIGSVSLASAGLPVVAAANAQQVRLSSGAAVPFPGGPGHVPPQADGILAVDFNYDFKNDLVLAGADGVRFLRQDSPESFKDVSDQTKLPKPVESARYTGAWGIDVEADGDVDIALGSEQGEPVVLRNNGDGSFLPIHPFPGISGLRQFSWSDLDGDGNPDAAIIDGGGRLHVFINERQGQFQERPVPTSLQSVHAVASGDFDGDGVMDLLAVQPDGAIMRVSDRNQGERWEAAEIARVPNAADVLANEIRLRIADLDNNGALDFYVSSVTRSPASKGPAAPLIWLGDQSGKMTLLNSSPGPATVFDAADIDGNGKLDLLGLSSSGGATEGINKSDKNYHWLLVQPHAENAVGDQRINPFGIGGDVEVRYGPSVQKQPITGPQLHFGLGTRQEADVVRVVWPNGTVSAEFQAKADREIVTQQRLKASCPFLFAYNGKHMEFIKDAVPWGSAIGLRINTLGSAKIAATGEWYKIGRDQLVPHDGYYDIRITAELWEVYYYDYLALMTVDHPEGTEIYVDERYAVPPARPSVTVVATPHEIRRAVDDTNNDVTALVRARDGQAVNSFGLGQYQGVTRDHYLELELGDDVPKSGPLYLIAEGSIHDTESSVNVAITQGSRWRAQGLRLEVPDGKGGWVTAQDNLGFPAGRKKTILLDLTGVFRPNTPRRVRIRTNLEIYWDAIHWAQGRPDVPIQAAKPQLTVADLHYRGYSVMHLPAKDEPRAPEVPDYDRLEGSKQRWRDLIGYYTRYGDVRELLSQTDDRYVIVNSGDEMSLRFAEQPAPPTGWLRDFVILGDGWIKDGDYNSTFSKTVQPLPYHAQDEYITRPGRLEDEWVYRQHPDDWKNYHTRYVTPEVFVNELRSTLPK